MRNLCGLNPSVCRFHFTVPALNVLCYGAKSDEERKRRVDLGGEKGQMFGGMWVATHRSSSSGI